MSTKVNNPRIHQFFHRLSVLVTTAPNVREEVVSITYTRSTTLLVTVYNIVTLHLVEYVNSPYTYIQCSVWLAMQPKLTF